MIVRQGLALAAAGVTVRLLGDEAPRGVLRPHKRKRLPVVLTRSEVMTFSLS